MAGVIDNQHINVLKDIRLRELATIQGVDYELLRSVDSDLTFAKDRLCDACIYNNDPHIRSVRDLLLRNEMKIERYRK